jgi:hypothetical protein
MDRKWLFEDNDFAIWRKLNNKKHKKIIGWSRAERSERRDQPSIFWSGFVVLGIFLYFWKKVLYFENRAGRIGGNSGNHATFKTRKVVYTYRVERGFSKIQKYA